MRYAQIRSMDISNGADIGVSLFVQGCHFHCHNCFNPETWNFADGKEWTEHDEDEFLRLINRPYIRRVSILGGEPLAEENVESVYDLITKIRNLHPSKILWLYSGYTWKQIMNPIATYGSNRQKDHLLQLKIETIEKCNVLVDGKYIDSQRDLTLKWRGSTNQRVIDVQKSFQNGEVVLWTT